MSVIAESLSATRKSLGALTVERLLPAAARQAVGPFLFLDHIGPAVFEPGQGVRIANIMIGGPAEKAGIKAGRFEVPDLECAVTMIAGGLLAIMRAMRRKEIGADGPERAAARGTGALRR